MLADLFLLRLLSVIEWDRIEGCKLYRAPDHPLRAKESV